ncbi:restriction endonuclease [Micromonospora chalcea]
MTAAGEEAERDSRKDPLWQRYEQSVRHFLSDLDPSAQVTHNKKVEGRLSQSKRQVDVWAVGSVVGVDVVVAIECKRYRRPVTVETIDQFVGKLIDIGAGIGVLYSYSGFTGSAVNRAEFATNPRVLAVALETPEIVLQLRGVPGYPAAFMAQDCPPLWVEDLTEGALSQFVETGVWPHSWL